MAKVSLYLDTRRSKKDGTYPVKVNVRHRGKFLVSTDFSSVPEEWNGVQYKSNANNYKAKNIAIRNLMNRVESLLLDLDDKNMLKSFTDASLKNRIEALISSSPTKAEKNFLYYMNEFMSLKTNSRTIEVYEATRKKIEAYDARCTFDTINTKWLTAFESFLLGTMKVNSCAIHMRNIRAVFNYAIDDELTTLYPFRKFKIKKEETRKRALTVEQLVTLRDYPCEPYQKKYRDLFLLMFYLIGINAVDLFNAKELIGGRLEYKRAKTGKLYSIRVEPEAMEIINKYKGKKQLLFVLDEYVNYRDFLKRFDMELKRIGECSRSGLGGKKHITPIFPELSSYWARHTWATIAHKIGISKDVISMALGHSFGNKVTDIYIDFDMEKVDEANRRVIDFIQK